MVDVVRGLFLAAEAEPFYKIGGLADVAGSLPLALRKWNSEGFHNCSLDVRLVLPFHPTGGITVQELDFLAEFPLKREDKNLIVKIYTLTHKGMPVYFIDGDPIKQSTGVYSNDPSHDQEKYVFFSLAALQLPNYIHWQPHILHANDWHTALAIYALKQKTPHNICIKTKSLITVHNLPFMGGDCGQILTAYGIDPSDSGDLPEWARTQPLPMGISTADRIIPVSPTYAKEILTNNFGCGLDPFFIKNSAKIIGILNGLDVDLFDPEHDSVLSTTYTADSLHLRAQNRNNLLSEVNLMADSETPILAMVGRIDYQKGVDITLDMLSSIISERWSFIILGKGLPELEQEISVFESTYPDRVRAIFRYDASLSRKIYAGADLFLMPSRYEPCGLAQLIAMRYGCVPVVRSTGGLIDTVQEGATGFLFPAPSAESMRTAINRAFSMFNKRDDWRAIQKKCMHYDSSWTRSADKYAQIYHELFSDIARK